MPETSNATVELVDGRPVTTVDGQRLTLDNCDREPVHVPGYVQSHGCLLSVDADDLRVRQCSANVAEWTGKGPDDILGRPLREVVGEATAERVSQRVSCDTPPGSPIHVTTVQAPAGVDKAAHLDVVVHCNTAGRLIVEIDRCGQHVVAPSSFRADDCEEPRPRLRPGERDYYGEVRQAVAALQRAESLADFCRLTCEQVRGITGLDRVMVYRFAEDDSGHVLGEAVADELGSWLDFHYPASDVPLPARQIFRKIWLRPLPDARAAGVPLVPELDPDTGRPLDLTHAYLRGASPMYTEYLENMGVAMSLTMPLMRGDQLWGLIACHHYDGPRLVPQPVRAACEFLAQVVSLQLAAAEARDQDVYRDELRRQTDGLMAQLAVAVRDQTAAFDLHALFRDKPDLLSCLDATGVAVVRDGAWQTVGNTPEIAFLDGLLDWLADRESDRSLGVEHGIYGTAHLAGVYPPAAAHATEAAGLLAVPIGRGGRDWILWFRPEQVREVTWGGNPHEKRVELGPNGARLHPRASFALWRETVTGRSRPWLPVEVDAARRVRQAVLEFAVAHAERLGQLNRDLASSNADLAQANTSLAQANRDLAVSNAELDAFAYVSSHDLKEPLRGIFGYAHHLREVYKDKLDEADRPKLDALMRLSNRMNDLIDSLLAISRVGRTDLNLEDVDLNEVLDDVLDLTGLNKDEPDAEVRVPRPLPTVRCDRVRVRAVLLNLVSNAAKYRREGAEEKPWVEIAWRRPDGGGPVEITVADNGIGIKPRYHEQIFQIFKRLHAQNRYGGGTGAGLTIVKKIIERHDGRIWLESEPGRGSRFTFTLSPGRVSE